MEPTWLGFNNVGHREIGVHAVYRGSPLHSAQGASLSGSILPDRGARFIWIERIADARFLPGDQHIPPRGEFRQDGRLPEIEIGADVFAKANRIG